MAKSDPAAVVPAKPRKPRISVLERRLQNPFGSPSATIELKDGSRVARWFNAAISNDKIWKAKFDGWQLVMPEEVADLDQVGGYGLAPAGGHIVRGERGQEVLMSYLKADYKAIQWAKQRHNVEHMGNPNAMKREVVEAAGRQIGSEAAEYLNKHVGPIGGVEDSYERIERTDPGE